MKTTTPDEMRKNKRFCSLSSCRNKLDYINNLIKQKANIKRTFYSSEFYDTDIQEELGYQQSSTAALQLYLMQTVVKCIRSAYLAPEENLHLPSISCHSYSTAMSVLETALVLAASKAKYKTEEAQL